MFRLIFVMLCTLGTLLSVMQQVNAVVAGEEISCVEKSAPESDSDESDSDNNDPVTLFHCSTSADILIAEAQISYVLHHQCDLPSGESEITTPPKLSA